MEQQEKALGEDPMSMEAGPGEFQGCQGGCTSPSPALQGSGSIQGRGHGPGACRGIAREHWDVGIVEEGLDTGMQPVEMVR